MRRVLVANRGEIARRVFRTCHGLGIGTVAVYSEPDRWSPHVGDADVAVPLGGTTAAESYLDIRKLLSAADRAGADAVHPGYGFLAENADFAAECERAGLVWIGPPPEAIRAMASKVESKRLVGESGVPLVPGATLRDDDPTSWMEAATEVGFPLLVKASAGGGGKGMRRVDDPAGVVEAIEAGRREAAGAFGDSTVFLERCLVNPRHVEVQVAADALGNVVHLHERDCSVQRRHQKVIEEAPAPALPGGLAGHLHGAAVAVASAIGYRSVGTVEFLVSGEEYFFLEMNTRLQVEHPVTEEVVRVAGGALDLVALQLRIAAGEPLGFEQHEVAVAGHSVEARLYAEDPANDHLPAAGRLERFTVPGDAGIRWEVGVASGVEVSPYYDPMLAKVIAAGATRREAIARLARALRGLEIHGIVTNRDALVAVLESAEFSTGVPHTGFLEDHPDLLLARPPARTVERHAVAAALALRERAAARRVVPPVAPAGWRNVSRTLPAVEFTTVAGGMSEVISVGVGPQAPGGLAVTVNGAPWDGEVLEATDNGVTLEAAGLRYRLRVGSAGSGDRHWVNGDGWQTELLARPRFAEVGAAGSGHGPSAPMPGTVVLVAVGAGDAVTAGDLLLVLEAMKMEHRITADTDGVVAKVLVSAGDRVDAHQLLVEIE